MLLYSAAIQVAAAKPKPKTKPATVLTGAALAAAAAAFVSSSKPAPAPPPPKPAPAPAPAPAPPSPQVGPNIAAIIEHETTPAGPTSSTAKPSQPAVQQPPPTVPATTEPQVGPNLAAIITETPTPVGPESSVGAPPAAPVVTFTTPSPTPTPAPASPSPKLAPVVPSLPTINVPYTPLTGVDAVNVMYQECANNQVDPLACAANAILEGADGAIGDSGSAYGPWQAHLTDGRLAQFKGDPAYSNKVQYWAWSAQGFAYAIGQMASGGARGLTGHDAVHAIVYGFEKPTDELTAYDDRALEYDRLQSMGSDVKSYLATVFVGPGGPGALATPPVGSPTVVAAGAYVPAGVNAQWRNLMDVFKVSAPAQSDNIKNINEAILGVMK